MFDAYLGFLFYLVAVLLAVWFIMVGFSLVFGKPVQRKSRKARYREYLKP